MCFKHLKHFSFIVTGMKKNTFVNNFQHSVADDESDEEILPTQSSTRSRRGGTNGTAEVTTDGQLPNGLEEESMEVDPTPITLTSERYSILFCFIALKKSVIFFSISIF